MNVASLELSRELYELSGWGVLNNGTATEFYYNKRYVINGLRMELDHYTDVAQQAAHLNMKVERGVAVPAYNLGYLLRKLPLDIELPDHDGDATKYELFMWRDELGYSFAYGRGDEYFDTASVWDSTLGASVDLQVTLDEPEDAATKLAIELFKQGVLTRDGDE